MKIGLRIFLGYFLIVGLAGFFVMRVFVDEVKPGVRQAMEDTLVDTANVLAELARRTCATGASPTAASRAASMRWLAARRRRARSGTSASARFDYRIYVTDARGIVVYDSIAPGPRQGLLALERRLPDPARQVWRALHAQRPERRHQQRDARGRAGPRRRRASSAC